MDDVSTDQKPQEQTSELTGSPRLTSVADVASVTQTLPTSKPADDYQSQDLDNSRPPLFPDPASPPLTPRQSRNVRASSHMTGAAGAAAAAATAIPAQNEADKHEDNRLTRRIIAEDPTFNSSTVSPLTDLCLKHCIDNFEYNTNVVSYLNDRQRRKLLDQLPHDLPLKVTSHSIPEDPYWTRCCRERWPVFNLNSHGGSWKRAFFEKMLEEAIETFVPGHTYQPRLEECVSYAAPYIQRLNIQQLLPPMKPQPKVRGSENESDNDSDSEASSEPILVDHLDLGLVLPKLTHLKEMAVCYTVKSCAMNFEWSIFQFTGRDCLNLSKAVQKHHGLQILRLTRSRVDSERCRVLVSHLLDHPSLVCLDLSHNIIGDRGSRALGKLINGRSKLSTLNLANNRLQSAGGLALAHAVAKPNCILERLNLRLNRLQDDGGVAIAKALMRNKTIKQLNLAANDLDEKASMYLAHVLSNNTTLTHLDLSNNQIGQVGAIRLQDGMQRNFTLVHLDLRFTGSSQEAEYAICQALESNQERLRKEGLDDEYEAFDVEFRKSKPEEPARGRSSLLRTTGSLLSLPTLQQHRRRHTFSRNYGTPGGLTSVANHRYTTMNSPRGQTVHHT